ncbi:Spermidine/putrescine ABC transporter ATPase subunit (plasmid) [Neorhizobium galegae bv. officinalis bv. officinalis str. HAMBI 1141]|uniref:Spermidine/putrescine import ATP-binding protein PotA n=1 Tax=Neorhizobium galegae bv. officinalis bv. officinalis str. HAMBI 1141 TaxID=1028801 RepID=A0A068TK01_NEOGA|nr:Spermidine/putrescine ABC transporter ATPase subunit [Neorhizobium galegae bv. officinalis bv. officinalis str. HAMBI 1141]
MNGEPIDILGIEKQFGDKSVVSDVSLSVKAGEFLSLLGPSGSGKTTLLMMIAGFEFPNSGQIRVGSRDITYLAPNRRAVGMVFQKYALFPHMTVEQNIAFPLRMRSLATKEINRRVSDMMGLVQLTGFEGRYPQQLSGGQQQRVAVARALIAEPPVLLMDEPLSALDKKLRETMQIEIKRIQNRVGVTVVYVTHDQEEALTMSDRIAVMSEGRLVQVGSPLDLYQRPATSFVAEFVGKMNFLKGEFVGSDHGTFRVRISGHATLPSDLVLNGEAEKYRAGGRVRVAVRPEDITIRQRFEPGHQSGVVLRGTVDAVIFLGQAHVILVQIEGQGEAPVQVLVPSLIGQATFVRGEKVDLAIAPSAVRLFPELAGPVQ